VILSKNYGHSGVWEFSYWPMIRELFIQSVGRGFPDILSKQIVDMPVAHGSGIWSEAVLVACPVQLSNFQQAPSMQFVNDLEALGKINAGSAWPLMDKHGHILGSFTVLLAESQELSDDDMSLIGIMIRDRYDRD
jgi:hypothetical protein